MPLTATVPEIKQAYRKLVMIYHPDKNNDDPYALARFTEIKEAYEVLMNPGKKELYLQERWLHKAHGKKIGDDLITAPSILKKCLELSKQISMMDIHRMHYAGMAQRILSLLNSSTITELKAQKETDVQHAIIYTLLKATTHFPYQETKLVAAQLQQLATDNPQLLKEIERTLEQKRKNENLNKFNGLVVFIVTILLCLLIYFMGH